MPDTAVNERGGGRGLSLAYLNQHAGDGHYIATNTANMIECRSIPATLRMLKE